ncbi:hypothetical protein N0V88_000075 [Collariella sp. IMI 366227]|nr:hypothetical protein N0V88_000075 [Collariella sp. IMI 366227]
MSIIREHTSATLSDAWRTIDIDALDPDSTVNFDTASLHPPQPEISEADARQLTAQVRQLLRGGDAEGALRGCLENPVYNGSESAREQALQTVIEVLQSIKVGEMSPLLRRVYGGEGELVDVLMKYLYKGMAATSSASQIAGRPGVPAESTGAAMSVLLSWHEKVVEVAGLGCIGRVMTDWRRV